MKISGVHSTGPSTRLVRVSRSCFLPPFIMAVPPFSPEWSQNGRDSLSTNGHDECIPDRLGRGLRGQTGVRSLDEEFLSWHINCLELRAIFLALIHFLPSLRGCHVIVRTDSSIPYNLPRGFTGMHTVSSFGLRTSSSPWERFTSWTSQPTFCGDRSSGSPAPLGIYAFSQPWPDMRLCTFPPVKLIPTVLCRVKESGFRLLLVAPFWPSQKWFSKLIPLLYRPPWEIPIRQNLLSLSFREISGTLNQWSGSCG